MCVCPLGFGENGDAPFGASLTPSSSPPPGVHNKDDDDDDDDDPF